MSSKEHLRLVSLQFVLLNVEHNIVCTSCFELPFDNTRIFCFEMSFVNVLGMTCV